MSTAEIDAAGHRVVHGGSTFRKPILLDADTSMRRTRGLADLAPLHNPPALAAIEALRSLRPDLPQVACFDTTLSRRPAGEGLHLRRAPSMAGAVGHPTFRLPRSQPCLGEPTGRRAAWSTADGTSPGDRPPRRRRLAGGGGPRALGRHHHGVHPDGGARDGDPFGQRRSRAGPLGAATGGLSADDVESALEHESGLRGLCGRSGDLRECSRRCRRRRPDGRLAYEVYVYRIQTSVAAICGAMRVSTAWCSPAGPASSPRLRADVCAGLGFLGLELETSANDPARGDSLISAPDAQAAVLVVTAREDVEIARHVRELLG